MSEKEKKKIQDQAKKDLGLEPLNNTNFEKNRQNFNDRNKRNNKGKFNNKNYRNDRNSRDNSKPFKKGGFKTKKIHKNNRR